MPQVLNKRSISGWIRCSSGKKVFYEQIPDEIKEAYSELTGIEDDKFSKQKTKKQRLKNCLKNLMTMPCFGYNSGMTHTT